jgi:ATP-binding cassette subfamily F protein uup
MERLGSKIVELHNVSKSFGDLHVLRHFNYVFKKADRIGIIGKNGSGKTSLLNIILGEIKPDTGKVVVGDTVKFGYYSQKGITIKPEQKVIDVVREFAEYIPLTKGRSLSAGGLLERFLFDRKQQYDFVEKLSGGEQKRLYLCIVLIQNPNFIVLDEPTNDLDIVTLNVLEDFLLDFPGTVLVVSHDRYFMDKIIDHLFVLEEGNIADFPGDYTDYKIYSDSIVSISEKETKTSSRDNSHKKPSLSFKEKKEFENIEKAILKLTEQKNKIEQAFVNASIPEDKMFQMGQELEAIISQIEEKEERWLELSMKME